VALFPGKSCIPPEIILRGAILELLTVVGAIAIIIVTIIIALVGIYIIRLLIQLTEVVKETGKTVNEINGIVANVNDITANFKDQAGEIIKMLGNFGKTTQGAFKTFNVLKSFTHIPFIKIIPLVFGVKKIFSFLFPKKKKGGK